MGFHKYRPSLWMQNSFISPLQIAFCKDTTQDSVVYPIEILRGNLVKIVELLLRFGVVLLLLDV